MTGKGFSHILAPVNFIEVLQFYFTRVDIVCLTENNYNCTSLVNYKN